MAMDPAAPDGVPPANRVLRYMAILSAALFLRGSVDKRHFADVADSVLYWFFVVLIWIPLYFMLYVAPRVL